MNISKFRIKAVLKLYQKSLYNKHQIHQSWFYLLFSRKRIFEKKIWKDVIQIRCGWYRRGLIGGVWGCPPDNRPNGTLPNNLRQVQDNTASINPRLNEWHVFHRSLENKPPIFVSQSQSLSSTKAKPSGGRYQVKWQLMPCGHVIEISNPQLMSLTISRPIT